MLELFFVRLIAFLSSHSEVNPMVSKKVACAALYRFYAWVIQCAPTNIRVLKISEVISSSPSFDSL